jgi:hypothetical protein
MNGEAGRTGAVSPSARRRSMLSLAAAAMCLLARAAPAAGDDVPFQVVGRNDYRNFVANWDDSHAVFMALIRTPSERFDDQMILVVSRVVGAPADGEKILAVRGLESDGGTLTLRYDFTPPAAAATFTVKEVLQLRIPRREVERVRVLENDVPVGELRPAEGVWSIPPPPKR